MGKNQLTNLCSMVWLKYGSILIYIILRGSFRNMFTILENISWSINWAKIN